MTSMDKTFNSTDILTLAQAAATLATVSSSSPDAPEHVGHATQAAAQAFEAICLLISEAADGKPEIVSTAALAL